MIAKSWEWSEKRHELQLQIKSLPYNPDLRKMLRNIDTMVEKLSKQEVVARRMKQDTHELAELQEVNTAIETLSQWIVMANLLR